MLLLSGVLLMLGFVVLGATLVQLQGLEGTTERTQRDSLMTTAENLVAGLNQTIRDSIVIGETNTTSFQATLRSAEASLRDNAVRSGVYASVQLYMEPLEDVKEIFWRESRCIGYDDQHSKDGIVIGWEEKTLQETIAGAVYDIHVTDGRQMFRSLVYVKIVDCAALEITSTHSGVSWTLGEVKDHTAMRNLDGNTANFTELLDWSSLVGLTLHPVVDTDSIEHTHWSQGWHLAQLDGEYARWNSNAAQIGTNKMQFQLDVPPILGIPGVTLDDIKISITGKWESSSLLPDPGSFQDLHLNVYMPDDPLLPSISEKIDLPRDTPGMVTVDLGSDWTYENLTDSVWEFRVTGVHPPSIEWYVDHFNMTGDAEVPQAYRLDAVVDWPNIPPAYGDHELFIRYRVEPGTEGEGFRLSVRDRADPDSEWTEIWNMTDTTTDPDDGVCVWDDGWCEVTLGPEDVDLYDRMQFRIVDTDDNDRVHPADQDVVQVDVFRVTSMFQDL